jgi:hypothetical protein
MSTGMKIKVVVFWASMIFLAVLLIKLNNPGKGALPHSLVSYWPLGLVVILFAFVLGIEIGIRRGRRT